MIIDTFGYGLYKDVLKASVGESLWCKQKTGNPHDSYAVSVLKGETIVGYVHVSCRVFVVCLYTEVVLLVALLQVVRSIP